MGLKGQSCVHDIVTVDSERRTEYRELRLLELVADSGEPLTQRALARRLGVALGLANLYLKRLVTKGCLKCVNVQPSRIRYLITPQGMTEKARLTYAFMDFSLELYGQARRHLRAALRTAPRPADARIAIFGTGEAAELTYLTLREQGVEPVAVFDRIKTPGFLGFPVRPITEFATVDFTLLVVATLDKPDAVLSELTGYGIPLEKLLALRHDPPETPTSGRGIEDLAPW